MENILERLKRLNDLKLIDTVKNHKQYGYDESVRNSAILILEERGIDIEQLKLSGNFKNHNYENAQRIYDSYRKNSLTAFIVYILSFIIQVNIFDIGGIIMLIINTLIMILYLIYLIKSFISQSNFYKAIGKDYGVSGAFLYLLLGMPLYFIMYFFFRNQMKEQLRYIN